jgi:hypothetical protein
MNFEQTEFDLNESDNKEENQSEVTETEESSDTAEEIKITYATEDDGLGFDCEACGDAGCSQCGFRSGK